MNRTQRFVRTEYRGPTDHQGSRVIAVNVTSKRRKVVPWDHALDALENHEKAARLLLGEACAFRGNVAHASIDGGGYLWTYAGRQ